MAEMKMTGKATLDSPSGVKVHCSARGKSFILDEPAKLGGTDEGMNPIEALLSSLGACKCIVGKMTADAMNIKIESFEVECVGTIDGDGFMGVRDDVKIGLSNIETIYNIKSSASMEELENLVAHVDKHCPVHDTIVNSPNTSHKINKL